MNTIAAGKYLALVPAYNEASNIADTVTQIAEYLPDILVVDDGSSDQTETLAQATCATVIAHPQNKGKGAALNTGFQYAIDKQFEAVITLDGDGQHNAAEIPNFIAHYEQHKPCMIIGSRMANPKDMPLIRKLTNSSTSKLISWLTKCQLTDTQSGYRLIQTNVIKDLDIRSEHYEAESEIIIKAGWNNCQIHEIPIDSIYHNQAKSNINPFVDGYRFCRLYYRLLKQKSKNTINS